MSEHRIQSILIIGGGIAGSGLASVLARDGFDVTLVERTEQFIDRIRGEFVHPWGVERLEHIGLLDVAQSHADAAILPFWTKYTDGEAGEPYRWSDDFPHLRGSLSVSHPLLQQALIEHAEAAGVRVIRPAALVDLNWDSNQPIAKVQHDEDTTEFRPDLVVGADGSRSLVRRLLGGTGVADTPHHSIGGALVQGIDLPADSAHQAYFNGGFVMVFPQGNDISRVYYVCSIQEAAALQRADQPAALLERLRSILPDTATKHMAGTDSPVGFFPNSETIATVRCGPHTVLIGDAASSNDPSQGHGLSLVFRDIGDLHARLHAGADPDTLAEAFANDRAHAHGVLRAHAHWVAPLSTETGPHIDALKARIAQARAIDPTAGGFAAIFATGPAGLNANEEARRHFLGEDIASQT